MQKRAQVTMFIILGMVIVIAIVIGVAFRKSISEQVSSLEIGKSEKAKQLENGIRAHAESCLKKIAIEGLQYIFANGGYYMNAPKSISYASYSVPYYLYGKKEAVPALEDVAVNLARYIDDNINPCLSSYSSDLVVGKASSEVSLGKTVQVEVTHSLRLAEGDTQVTVKSFESEVEANARDIYNYGIDFFNEVKNISEASLSQQGSLALRQKYEFSVPAIGSGQEIAYILYMKKAIEESRDIEYSFALSYPEVAGGTPEYEFLSSMSGFGLGSAENMPEDIEEDEEVQAPEGQEMSYLFDNSEQIFKEMHDSNAGGEEAQ